MMRVGDSAALTRTWTTADLTAFAALTGWAGGDGVPDPLIGAMLSCLLGTRLPGPGISRSCRPP
jgi:3-hydroxybutyryl-CoA dehydratase